MVLRRLLILVCLLCTTATSQAAAVAPKPFKIMMLLYRGVTDAEKGFMNYFAKHNIPVEYIVRDAQADNSRIADFVREAKEIRPDLIYTFGTTITAQVVGLQGEVDPARHITDIPVVFDIVADPVGARLVTSLKSSGRNVTGASHLVPLAAQMNALQTMRPTRSLGVIYNPQEKNSQLTVQELERIAPQFKLNLHLEAVGQDAAQPPKSTDVTDAVRELIGKKPQAIYIPSDSFMIKNARRIIQEAHAAKIPVFAATEAPIRNDGALLGLVSTYFNVGELAAYKADQILSGKTAPEKLPVETLNRFTYLINMGAAKKIGVYPPLSVVKFAELLSPLEGVDARE